MRNLTHIGCVLALTVVMAVSGQAQVSKGGSPLSVTKGLSPQIPRIIMDAIDVPKLLAEDSAESQKGIPLRFGFPFDVDYNLDNSGKWEDLADGGRVWRLRIDAPKAHSINLIFKRFWLPEGATFHIYNEDRSVTLGAFTSDNNKESGMFATSPVKGDVSILEYYEPADVRGWGIVQISRIVHAYRNLFDRSTVKDASDFGGSGSCNNNVNCPEGAPWEAEKRSVALITTSGGFRLCTGAMVNNVRQDLKPYFLTANHCLGGEATWVFIFNYESPSCANIDGPLWMSVSGSTLRATNAFSDFALLELSEQPPDSYGVYYAGWNAVDAPSTNSVGIHHPDGDIKKISFDNDPTTSTTYLENGAGNGSHWRITMWDDGTTEPGSSGSPLFDQNHRITGQLHGGFASCASLTSDWYGKFSKSWATGGTVATRLKEWLDPDNTGTLILDGRDAAGVKITHTPLNDTQDTLNDYSVICEIISPEPLDLPTLQLFYRINAGSWTGQQLTATGNPDEYEGTIPAQSAGTDIDYYLYAADTTGEFDVTDTLSFSVLDYAVSLTPASDTAFGAVDDTVWYSLTVTNLGAISDNYTLAASGNVWTTTLWNTAHTMTVSSTPTLAPNGTYQFDVSVIVPSSVFGNFDLATITATSIAQGSTFDASTLRTVSEGEPLLLPFVDNFPATAVDAGKWVHNVGATIDTVGISEPSAPYSLRMNGSPVGADTLSTQAIDLSLETSVAVRYFFECKGGGESPDVNDDLVFEYRDSTGTWKELHRHLGTAPDMTTYDSVFVWLPGDAYGPNFRLRIRNSASVGASDDWFVDNVRIESLPAPDINATPFSINHTLAPDDSTTDNLIITNLGPGTLVYQAAVIPTPNKTRDRFEQLRFAGLTEPARREYPEGFEQYKDPKGSDDPRTGFPVNKDAGGPDNFGYYWIDSDESGGPTFSWIDISGTGTDVTGGLSDDNSVGPFNIGFSFPYYGQVYTQFYIGSNGIIGFTNDNMGSRFKATIPTASTPNNILAWLWDDLDPTNLNNPGGKVYMQTIGSKLIIQFKNYPEYQGSVGDIINAEVILEADGSVTFQYQNIAPGFDILNCAVGIENPAGSDGLEVAYLSSYLHNSLAVRFYQPYQWLTLSQLNGTVNPGEADTIIAHTNSSGLDSGTYHSTIVITSNDPDGNENPLEIFGTLQVQTGGPSFVCGDVNNNGNVTIADLIYLVQYLFNSGVPPPVPQAADVNSSGTLTIADLTYLVQFLFNSGPPLNCP